MEGRVGYEIAINDTNAALLRLIRAVLATDATLGPLCRCPTIATTANISPVRAEEFEAICKPIEMRYRPAEIFDGQGSIVARYATPEEELSGREKWPDGRPSDRLEAVSVVLSNLQSEIDPGFAEGDYGTFLRLARKNVDYWTWQLAQDEDGGKGRHEPRKRGAA